MVVLRQTAEAGRPAIRFCRSTWLSSQFVWLTLWHCDTNYGSFWKTHPQWRKMIPQDWPVGHFLGWWGMWENPEGSAISGMTVLGPNFRKQSEQATGSKPVSSSAWPLLLCVTPGSCPDFSHEGLWCASIRCLISPFPLKWLLLQHLWQNRSPI